VCIRHILKRKMGLDNPTFQDVRDFYTKNLHPETIDIADENVWKNVFHKGRWAGIFQFTESGAQAFCKKVKPDNITDLAAITSIYRPGPLAAGVDRAFMGAKRNPEDVEYVNEVHKSSTEETYGFLIFQEQIALLAHKLGKDLSLDEGNKLRKLLTKKGTGEVQEQKDKIWFKFREGCIEKGMPKWQAKELWDKFEYFSGYGFNKSHAVSYSMLSYQCAWLFNYYQSEWMAAFLDKEPETRKEKAINIARSFGFEIEKVNINTSGSSWEISEDGKTLIQPLTSIKGLGESAISQILSNRPFNNVEDFIFNEEMVYSKVNKKSLDVLSRSGALSPLLDDRFSGDKHFWYSVAVDRPRKVKNLQENIEMYRHQGSFTEEETISNLVELTGFFPMHLVMDDAIKTKLEQMMVPPISEFDQELKVTWFIPRELKKKKTKNGKTFYVLKVIDSNNEVNTIRCWGVDPQKDKVFLNRPYMANLDWNPQWGFSTRSVRKRFKLLA
jgi:DNA polymerase III alpha subunit